MVSTRAGQGRLVRRRPGGRRHGCRRASRSPGKAPGHRGPWPRASDGPAAGARRHALAQGGRDRREDTGSSRGWPHHPLAGGSPNGQVHESSGHRAGRLRRAAGPDQPPVGGGPPGDDRGHLLHALDLLPRHLRHKARAPARHAGAADRRGRRRRRGRPPLPRACAARRCRGARRVAGAGRPGLGRVRVGPGGRLHGLPGGRRRPRRARQAARRGVRGPHPRVCGRGAGGGPPVLPRRLGGGARPLLARQLRLAAPVPHVGLAARQAEGGVTGRRVGLGLAHACNSDARIARFQASCLRRGIFRLGV
mmetsp:Transcript_27233/g.73927  ORF Transcript_27233/g.73927 Transcript_27233/m.73927 type:complete len:307 (-) Transcript_27233:232-1152(-)